MRIAIIGMIALVAASAHALTVDDFASRDLAGRTLSTGVQSGAGEVVATVDEGLLYRSDPGTDGYAVLGYRLPDLIRDGLDGFELDVDSPGPLAVTTWLYGPDAQALSTQTVGSFRGALSIPLSGFMGRVPLTLTGVRFMLDPGAGASFSIAKVSAVPSASPVPEPASFVCVGVGVLELRRRRR